MPCRSIPSPNRLLHLFLRLLLALAVTVGAFRPAAAADDDVKRAREHHKAGDQAFKSGRYQDAYREWEAGFNLSGRPLFLLNMAHAERRRGELHNARVLYRRFLLMEPQTKLRGEVESVLGEIDAALAEAPARAREAATEPAPAEVVTPPAPSPAAPSPALSLLGSPTEPPSPPSFVATTVSEQPAPRPPLYKRWWFWTGLGVAAAAGGASLFLLRGDRYTKMGSIGTVGSAR